MYTPFAPMSRHTVQFAKDYRAGQIRAAERSRLTAQYRSSRHGEGRFHRWDDGVIAVRSSRSTAPAD